MLRIVLLLAISLSRFNAAALNLSDETNLSAPNVVPMKNLIRSDDATLNTVNTNDRTHEERVNIPGMAHIVELASKVTPAARNTANRLWFALRTNPRDVFMMLGLQGMKLQNNPKVLQWLRYVKMYRGHDFFTDRQIYELLAKSTPEKELAVFFYSFKKIPDLKMYGKRLQSMLFKKWIDEKLEPKHVASLLEVKTGPKPPKSDPSYVKYKIYEEYNFNFIAHVKEQIRREQWKKILG